MIVRKSQPPERGTIHVGGLSPFEIPFAWIDEFGLDWCG